MSQLNPSAQSVREVLEARGLNAQVQHMSASTRTGARGRRRVRMPGWTDREVADFPRNQSGKPYLLLVSGSNRVDDKFAAAQVGEPLGRPDAQFAREATGFAIGGIPPLGHASPIPTFIDEALLGYDLVWAAPGTPDAVFAIAPERLARAIPPKPISVSPVP